MAQFFTIITAVGQAKLAAAIQAGTTISLTHMAVGDGNGNPITPSESMTALVRERYRAQITSLRQDDDNANWLVAELVIPATEGGWTIHEAGLFDTDGAMIAVANFPATYKPVMDEGSTRELVVRIILEVSDTAAVTLVIDSTIVMASRQWVIDNFSVGKLLPGGLTHQVLRKKSNTAGDVEWADYPQATEEQLGLIELATSAEAIALLDAEKAITPDKLGDVLAALVTPPQFDNSTKAATTAFTQRALGNFRGLREISESCTLTAADIGMLLIVGGAGPITINLPPASVCAPVSGAGFEFAHSGLYPVTLQCAGTDKIVLGTTGQGLSSIVLQPADSLAIKSAGSLYWYNHGGSAQLPYVARYETMWIGAGAMVPCKTNGATAGTNEYASSLLNVDYMEFGAVADTAAEAAFVLPQNWDKGTMRAKLHWVPALGTAVEGQYVGWKLAAGATGESTVANRNLCALPFGGAVTVEDQVGPASTNMREHVSAASAPISCGSPPQTGDRITLRVTRDSDYAGAGAAMPVPAWLIGLEIQYRVVGRAEAWS